MNPIIIDIETTIRNTGEDSVGNLKASPFHPDNKVVLFGIIVCKEFFLYPEVPLLNKMSIDKHFLIGHNIKFDLLWMLREDSEYYKELLQNCMIWDTMVVEYLLTGQQDKFISLDALSERYGGTRKDKKIAEYWEAGVDTTDIPEEDLAKYLQQDLANTEIIATKQMKDVMDRGMERLVGTQMEALIATTIMEHNGMYFDIRTASDITEEVELEYYNTRKNLIGMMSAVGIQSPNPDSTHHISYLVYGGDQLVDTKIVMKDKDGNVINYKTGSKKGSPRYKKVSVRNTIPGIISPKFHLENLKSGTKGIYKTNTQILQEFLDKDMDKAGILESILKYRTLAKDINTYLLGFVKHYWPNDRCIHGSLNHTSTNTGRLSSSSPNIQNLSGVGK